MTLAATTSGVYSMCGEIKRRAVLSAIAGSFMLCLVPCGSAPGYAAPSAVGGERIILSFPKDYIAGSLYRLKPAPTGGFASHYSKFYATARGDVPVSPDMKFDLKISYQGGENLSFLDSLPPGYVSFLEMERLPVTDQQFRALKCLPRLQGLTLTDVDITDRGFMELQKARELSFLVLKSSLVTGKGLVALRNLHDMLRLDTEQNMFDDASLANLSGMKKLHLLRLKNARITDAGLKHLAPLSNLSDLSLAINKITDAGVACLIPLKNLRKLNLTDTKITIKCIESLAQLPKLERVTLSYCDFTPAQLDLFKKRLHCEIVDGRATGTDINLFSPLH